MSRDQQQTLLRALGQTVTLEKPQDQSSICLTFANAETQERAFALILLLCAEARRPSETRR